MEWKDLIGNVSFSLEACKDGNYGLKGHLYANETGLVHQVKKYPDVFRWENITVVKAEIYDEDFTVTIEGQVRFIRFSHYYRCPKLSDSPLDLLIRIREKFENEFQPKILEEPTSAKTTETTEPTGFQAQVIDGSGWSPIVGSVVSVELSGKDILFNGESESIRLPIAKLTSLKIEGFSQTQDAGIEGGGFGVKKAIEGMFLASIANRLTRKTSNWVMMEIQTSKGMTVLRLPGATAIEVRKHFRKAQDAVITTSDVKETRTSSDFSEQLERITNLYEDGLLTPEEFAVAKKRLLKNT